jgi:hypothetical protein
MSNTLCTIFPFSNEHTERTAAAKRITRQQQVTETLQDIYRALADEAALATAEQAQRVRWGWVT